MFRRNLVIRCKIPVKALLRRCPNVHLQVSASYRDRSPHMPRGPGSWLRLCSKRLGVCGHYDNTLWREYECVCRSEPLSPNDNGATITMHVGTSQQNVVVSPE